MNLRVACLMIAVVVMCPHLCMGELSVSTSMCQTICGCSQNETGPADPGAPADHNHDCLCDGAVANGEVRTDDCDLRAPQAFSYECIVTPSVYTDSRLTFISFERSHHFPPLATGRDVCALTCTLLI